MNAVLSKLDELSALNKQYLFLIEEGREVEASIILELIAEIDLMNGIE